MYDNIVSPACATLVQAFDLQDLREVAVKLHQLSSSWSDVKKASYVKHAVREYKIHRQLRSATMSHTYLVSQLTQADAQWLGAHQARGAVAVTCVTICYYLLHVSPSVTKYYHLFVWKSLGALRTGYSNKYTKYTT